MMIGMRLRVGMKLSRDFVMLSDFPTGIPPPRMVRAKGRGSTLEFVQGMMPKEGSHHLGVDEGCVKLSELDLRAQFLGVCHLLQEAESHVVTWEEV